MREEEGRRKAEEEEKETKIVIEERKCYFTFTVVFRDFGNLCGCVCVWDCGYDNVRACGFVMKKKTVNVCVCLFVCMCD